MSFLYDETAGVTISEYVTMEQTPDQVQVISTSLDGSVYIQNIGEPQLYLSGDVYVDRAGKANIETAWEEGNLLRADLKHGTYYGRITKLSIGNRLPHDMFKATVTLAEEAAL
jgi:fermentation-respiration switch protein FrsA (DUF1100 family)